MSTVRLNPAKLLHSKWTAVQPQHREKHFMVTRLLIPEDGGPVQQVELEAVLTRRSFMLPWQQLANSAVWLQGWK